MSKPVDLKCEETLRDSPPPQQAYQTTTPSAVSTIQNLGTPTTTGGDTSSSSTFNIFVRKFDPQTAELHQRNSPSSLGSHGNVSGTVKATKLESPKPQSAYISPFYPQSSVLYAPVTKFLQQQQVFSSMFQTGGFPLEQSYHPLIKNVSPIKMQSSEVGEQHSASAKQPNLAKVISLPAVIPRTQSQKVSQASVSDAQASGTARPVTLHINTGKGTAVVQLQQSTSISPSSSKQMSITPKRSTVIDSQQLMSPTSTPGRPIPSTLGQTTTVISSLPNLPSRIFPSPISLPPTAAAAYLYQDSFTAYQTLATLQSMNTKLNASTATMHNPTSMPFVVGPGGGVRASFTQIHEPSLLAQTRLGLSPLKPQSSSTGFASSPTAPGSSSQLNNSNNGSSTVAGTPGQSPRPSILRKRPSELSAISSVSKKLTYDSLATTPRKLLDGPSSLAADEVVISTTRAPEHPDAGNSNHSSSASTVSAGSALDGHSNSSYPDNATNRSLSPSPRKRPRKQNLDDLPEGGGGGELDSDDERLSTETLVAGEPPDGFADVKLNIRQDSTEKADFAEPMKLKTVKIEMTDENCSKVTRRPRPSLWSSGETTWQPRRNHFLHYDDVKPKEEKKQTAAEICNQKQIWQKIEGWRLHMIAMNVDDLDKCQENNLDDLDSILRSFDSPNADEGLDETELGFMKEMVMTSVQRCKAVREQLNELKKPLFGILKHKRNVETLVQKYSAKRPLRKKEKADL